MRIGYTNRQQCILDGKLPMKDIKRVEIRELARRAELNNDQEVLDSLDGILKQYDLWVESHYTKRQMRYITGEKPAEEIGQYALAKLYERAKKQGDEQIAEWAWDLMTRNNKSSFSQWQMRIIRGVIPTEKVGEGALMSLANRALFLKDQEIVDWAVERLKERGIAYTPVLPGTDRQVTGYTPRQKRIISGEIPFENLGADTINSLLERAMLLKDAETEAFARDYLERRLKDPPSHHKKNAKEKFKGYTEKQRKIIIGEVDYDTIKGTAVHHMLKKAISMNDEPVIELSRKILKKARERSRKESNEKTKQKLHIRKTEGGFGWKPPRAAEYSELQKLIIAGEIPLYKVPGKDIVAIHQKAKAMGDHKTAEAMLDITMDRLGDAKERKQRSSQKDFDPEKIIENYEPIYRGRTSLSNWEIRLLNSEIDPDYCTVAHARHILEVAKFNHDEKNERLASMFLELKQHPDSIYITHDHKEAMGIIEMLLGMPLAVKKPKKRVYNKLKL